MCRIINIAYLCLFFSKMPFSFYYFLLSTSISLSLSLSLCVSPCLSLTLSLCLSLTLSLSFYLSIYLSIYLSPSVLLSSSLSRSLSLSLFFLSFSIYSAFLLYLGIFHSGFGLLGQTESLLSGVFSGREGKYLFTINRFM